jgi:sulfofructose kinase
MGIQTVLDAGSRHLGTEQLADQVDYLIASAKFARQMTGAQDRQREYTHCVKNAPHVVVTDGAQGAVLGAAGEAAGHLPAFDVPAVDSTGAGDTFHGAFAWALRGRWHGWKACVSLRAAAGAVLHETGCAARYSKPGRGREVSKAKLTGYRKQADMSNVIYEI